MATADCPAGPERRPITRAWPSRPVATAAAAGKGRLPCNSGQDERTETFVGCVRLGIAAKVHSRRVCSAGVMPVRAAKRFRHSDPSICFGLCRGQVKFLEKAIRGFFRMQKNHLSSSPNSVGATRNSHEFSPTVKPVLHNHVRRIRSRSIKSSEQDFKYLY